MLKLGTTKIITALMMVALAGCQTVAEAPESQPAPPQSSTARADADTVVPLPAAVQRELLPDLLGNADKSQLLLAERRFDIAANEVDARQLFAGLVENTPYSIAFHPQVSGTITLNLKQVTLADALSVIEDIYGYDISREGRVLRIFPAAMRTETFSFNYLMLQRVGVSQTSISSGGITERENSGSSGSSSSNSNSSGSGGANNANNTSSGSSSSTNNSSGNGTIINSRTETDLWKELEETLGALIEGEGRQVLVSPQSGLVTVKAFPDEIRTVKEYLKRSEQHLQRQVILEARIVEVRLDEGFQQGINWTEVIGHIGDTNLNFSTSTTVLNDRITADLGGVTSLTFRNSDSQGNTDFAGVLKLLKTQGDVNVLSSPRITATNNQKAVIKVGQDEYFVTDVSSTSSSVGNNVVANPQVELTPFFSGIALDVTPQIDELGAVLLHVHPSVIEVNEQTKQIEVQGQSFQLPLARSTIRESDTVIKATSGDVVVIGGLMSSLTRDQVSKVPLLGDIPWLGEAFTNKLEVVNKVELVILLRPRVIGQDSLQRQQQRSRELLEQWQSAE